MPNRGEGASRNRKADARGLGFSSVHVSLAALQAADSVPAFDWMRWCRDLPCPTVHAAKSDEAQIKDLESPFA